jgi:hypothetical protein
VAGGAGVAQPDIALAQAGGAPLAALAYADPLVEAERLAWVASLSEPERAFGDGLAARIDAVGRISAARRLAWAIDWLIGWNRGSARVAAGGRCARRTRMRRVRWRVSRAGWRRTPLFRYHRSLLRQRALVAHPLVPRLVAESLLIEYSGAFSADDMAGSKGTGQEQRQGRRDRRRAARVCCRSTFARKAALYAAVHALSSKGGGIFIPTSRQVPDRRGSLSCCCR